MAATAAMVSRLVQPLGAMAMTLVSAWATRFAKPIALPSTTAHTLLGIEGGRGLVRVRVFRCPAAVLTHLRKVLFVARTLIPFPTLHGLTPPSAQRQSPGLRCTSNAGGGPALSERSESKGASEVNRRVEYLPPYTTLLPMNPAQPPTPATQRSAPSAAPQSSGPAAPSLEGHTLPPTDELAPFTKALDLLDACTLRASILDMKHILNTEHILNAKKRSKCDQEPPPKDIVPLALAHLRNLPDSTSGMLLAEFFGDKANNTDPCPAINHTTVAANHPTYKAAWTCRSILETGVITPFDVIHGADMVMKRVGENQFSRNQALLAWASIGGVVGAWIFMPGPFAIGCTGLAVVSAQRLASAWQTNKDIAEGYVLESAHMLQMIRVGRYQRLSDALNETFGNPEARGAADINRGKVLGFILARALRVLRVPPEEIFEGVCTQCSGNQYRHPLEISLRKKLAEKDFIAHSTPKQEHSPKTALPLSLHYTNTQALPPGLPPELLEVLDHVHLLSALRERDLNRSSFAKQVLLQRLDTTTVSYTDRSNNNLSTVPANPRLHQPTTLP